MVKSAITLQMETVAFILGTATLADSRGTRMIHWSGTRLQQSADVSKIDHTSGMAGCVPTGKSIGKWKKMELQEKTVTITLRTPMAIS